MHICVAKKFIFPTLKKHQAPSRPSEFGRTAMCVNFGFNES